MNLAAQPRSRRPAGDRGAGIGWAAALLLHVLLLAALISRPPIRPRPAPAPAAVSLLVLPATPQPATSQPTTPQPATPQPVAPRPAARPMPPPRATAVFGRAPSQAEARNAAARQVPARRSPQPQAPVAAAPPPQGFVAAVPLGRDVNPPPEYPAAAVAHGEQGSVLLSIHVLPDGLTDFVGVTQSSGYRILDDAARQAVLRWRFQPARDNGGAVVMVIPFRINFNLATQSAQPAGPP